MSASLRPPIVSAIDRDGDYHALQLAEIVGFTNREMAEYLGKHAANVARAPTAGQSQLAALAGLVAQLGEIIDKRYMKAWFVTPIPVLDDRAPKELILEGKIKVVSNLLKEIDSGFAL